MDLIMHIYLTQETKFRDRGELISIFKSTIFWIKCQYPGIKMMVSLSEHVEQIELLF